MTNLTPEQLVEVANEIRVNFYGLAAYVNITNVDPDLANEVKLALFEWCAKKGIIIYLDGDSYVTYKMQPDGFPSHTIREDESVLFNVFSIGKSVTEAMLDAVLSYLEDNKKVSAL